MDPVLDPVIVEQTAALAATDFSLWALFLRADLVVKAVMIGLIAASVWSWTIIFEKTMTLRKLFSGADDFEKQFWSGEPLQNLYRRLGDKSRGQHPMAAVFMAGMREWSRSGNDDKKRKSAIPIDQKIDRVLTTTIAREMSGLEKRLLFLASVGAVAPFVGLFGTVWGIMNSFQAIALSQNTNLAVVAPGIAEALFATGLGLLAAIPAVLAYNKFTSDLGRYAGRLDIFADEFSAFLARQTED